MFAVTPQDSSTPLSVDRQGIRRWLIKRNAFPPKPVSWGQLDGFTKCQTGNFGNLRKGKIINTAQQEEQRFSRLVFAKLGNVTVVIFFLSLYILLWPRSRSWKPTYGRVKVSGVRTSVQTDTYCTIFNISLCRRVSQTSFKQRSRKRQH